MINHAQEAIQYLEKTGDYQIQERLQPVARYHSGQPESKKIGIVLDTETTGLDTSKDKVIELGFIVFEYDANSGAIYKIVHTYNAFEDPKQPLDDIVKQITGISDDMLVGKSLDEAEAEQWLAKADIIIAHNAAYDRQILERRLPSIKQSHWACSIQDIDWLSENIGSRKLDYIAYKMGFFFDAHRAVNDAQATLHLLSKTLPCSQQLAMKALLTKARATRCRFFAVSAPFAQKDTLKGNGYRWLADVAYQDAYGKNKKGVWSKVVLSGDADKEGEWLDHEVYQGKKRKYATIEVDATNRYSRREFQLEWA